MVGKSLPSCVQARIEAIKKEPRWNPPATVTEYRYEGRTVYLFSSPCCDQYNELWDTDCHYICAPSGGYTGRGDEKCTGFKDKAERVKGVWKDDRE
ncbi:hypothetical protein HRH25_13960 [Flavisolibacter sp. BT320]|nr:hypothetical protein [Flavisolibacter longurius]